MRAFDVALSHGSPALNTGGTGAKEFLAFTEGPMFGKRWRVNRFAQLTGRGHLFETCGIPGCYRHRVTERRGGMMTVDNGTIVADVTVGAVPVPEGNRTPYAGLAASQRQGSETRLGVLVTRS
jgi:hypothetical protein